MFLAVHILVVNHTQISVLVAVAAETFPCCLLLLQRRSLHGDHYSRFHVLNKWDCKHKEESKNAVLALVAVPHVEMQT